MVLNLIFIAVICVCIIDVSGFIGEIETLLTKLLGFKVRIPKPLSCSLCMTFWTGLVYLLVWHLLTLGSLALLLCVAVCTPVIENLIWNVRDILGILINIPMTFTKNR